MGEQFDRDLFRHREGMESIPWWQKGSCLLRHVSQKPKKKNKKERGEKGRDGERRGREREDGREGGKERKGGEMHTRERWQRRIMYADESLENTAYIKHPMRMGTKHFVSTLGN